MTTTEMIELEQEELVFEDEQGQDDAGESTSSAEERQILPSGLIPRSAVYMIAGKKGV